MRWKAALWAPTMAMCLGLTVAGCGGSSPIDFDRVTWGQLPIELRDWEKDRNHEQPSILTLEHENEHYAVIRGAKCPSSVYQLKVTGAERTGTGQPTLGISASLGKPWWKRADTTPSYPEDYVRLKWKLGSIPDRFGLRLGDARLAMRLQKQMEEEQPGAIRFYTTDTPFTCGQPEE